MNNDQQTPTEEQTSQDTPRKYINIPHSQQYSPNLHVLSAYSYVYPYKRFAQIVCHHLLLLLALIQKRSENLRPYFQTKQPNQLLKMKSTEKAKKELKKSLKVCSTTFRSAIQLTSLWMLLGRVRYNHEALLPLVLAIIVKVSTSTTLPLLQRPIGQEMDTSMASMRRVPSTTTLDDLHQLLLALQKTSHSSLIRNQTHHFGSICKLSSMNGDQSYTGSSRTPPLYLLQSLLQFLLQFLLLTTIASLTSTSYS